MTDQVRSVVVRLSANTAAYLAQMKAAGAETQAVSAGMSRSVAESSATQERALRGLATTAKFATGAVVLGFGAAIKTSIDFAAQMALVQTLSHSTARQMQVLSNAALTVGQKYGYTAIQVADAQAELIKAGISTKDILGGSLTGALTLAAAGQTDVATATEVAAAAMTQFKLKGKDVPHIADLLAAGADKALGSVVDLGYALSHAGLTAHQFRIPIEDTVGTLTAFAQAGLIGERAGTTFQQVLLRLASAQGAHLKLMDHYGISLYKANGQIKTMPQLADNLQRSLEHLAPAERNHALAVIFGQRAIQGANVLLAEGGKGIQSWINKVNDQGFAAQQASGKLNSLAGDWTKLKSATETAFIEMGSSSQGPLRQLVQDTTAEINKITKNGDLQRWSGEITRDFESVGRAAFPLAKDVGGVLKTLGTDAKHVADAFNSLPSGVQKLLVTGGILAYGANKIGLLKPVLKGLTGGGLAGTIASKAAPVPVFVTNPGFGLPGGAAGAAAGEGAAAATAAEGTGILGSLKALLGKGSVTDIAKTGGRLGTAADLSIAGMSFADSGAEMPFKQLNYTLPQLYAMKQAQDRAKALTQTKALIESQSSLNKLLMAPAIDHYAKKLAALPKGVQTAISTPGAIGSSLDVQRLHREYNLTPRQVRTVFELSGVNTALSATRLLAQQLDGLHNKRVNVTVAINGASHLASVRANLALIGGNADGGTIGGMRHPYGDKVLMPLAPGEEVISNRRGQADRWRPFLKQINAGLADGGTAGHGMSLPVYLRNDLDLKWPETLKQWNRALNRSTNAITNETTARDNLVNSRDQLAATVSGAFQPNIFDTSNRPANWAWLSQADKNKQILGGGNPIAALNASTTQANEFDALLKKLNKEGLKGGAFTALANTGDLATARAYATETPAQLKALTAAFNRNQAASARVGRDAGQLAYGKQIAAANKSLTGMEHELGLIKKEIAAYRKEHKNDAATFGSKINAAASNARRGPG